MKQRLLLMGILLFGVFGSLLAYNLYKRLLIKTVMEYKQRPPVTVSASVSKSDVWNPTLPAVGSLVAIQGVNVSSQVSGQVIKILFEDGQPVEEGALLVVLDDSVEQAQLEDAQAEEALAAIAVRRFRPLLAKGGISPFQMDKLNAKLKEAKAQVQEVQAKIAYKHIRAPFSGRLGIRQVDLGEFVQAGKELVRLDTQGSLYADFTLSERDLEKVFVGQEITITIDTVPDRGFPGKVMAISPQVDETTRSFSLRANVPNTDNLLYPGLFANIEVHLKEEENVVTVPKTAVSYSLYGDTVYVVNKTGKKQKGKSVYTVKRVAVKPGQERKDEIAILQGLQANQKVVTSGQLKLQNGSTVVLKDTPLQVPKTIPLD